MSTFAFRAVDLAGVPSRGEVDADSKAAVSEQLRERGLIVLDVSEKSEAYKLESLFDRFRAIKTRDMSVFARQFATLIQSGMPMLRSLYTLEDQTEDERLKDAIAGVRGDVEAGSSLADAMERRPQIFDNLFRAMVRSGESSGRLRRSSRVHSATYSACAAIAAARASPSRFRISVTSRLTIRWWSRANRT